MDFSHLIILLGLSLVIQISLKTMANDIPEIPQEIHSDDDDVNDQVEVPEIIGRSFRNCDQCGISLSPRIIGGIEANPHEFPWMAQVKAENRFICGATLIGHSYVLTAAHCFTEKRNDVTVVLGSHRLSTKKGVVVRKVVSVTIHPEFDAEKGKANDVAILKLDYPLHFGRLIRPICLATKDEQFIGQNGTVAGWGRTSVDSPLSDRLLKLDLPIIGQAKCRQDWFNEALPPGTFCAGYEYGKKDSCFGDSGSPLMCIQNGKWHQVGIVTWGAANSCALTYGVYVRITSYLDWISSNIADDKCFNQV